MEEQSRNSTYSLIGSLGTGLTDDGQILCSELSGDDYLLYSCVKLYQQLNSQNLSATEHRDTGKSKIHSKTKTRGPGVR